MMATKKKKVRRTTRVASRRGIPAGFATLAFEEAVPAAETARAPASPGETYLLGLLATQAALDAALNALTARAGEAGADETDFILVQKGLIRADYLKVDAQIGAYLSNQTIFKQIDGDTLEEIKAILSRIQGFTARRNKASEIVDAVTELLSNWS